MDQLEGAKGVEPGGKMTGESHWIPALLVGMDQGPAHPQILEHGDKGSARAPLELILPLGKGLL